MYASRTNAEKKQAPTCPAFDCTGGPPCWKSSGAPGGCRVGSPWGGLIGPGHSSAASRFALKRLQWVGQASADQHGSQRHSLINLWLWRSNLSGQLIIGFLQAALGTGPTLGSTGRPGQPESQPIAPKSGAFAANLQGFQGRGRVLVPDREPHRLPDAPDDPLLRGAEEPKLEVLSGRSGRRGQPQEVRSEMTPLESTKHGCHQSYNTSGETF